MSARKFWKRVEELQEDGRNPEEAIEFVRREFYDEWKKELEEEVRRELKEVAQKREAELTFKEFEALSRERRTFWYMRMAVVITFSVIGPVLLVAASVLANIQSTVLDIFKIWLGAAIGISTNLLQRREEAPVAVGAPKK